MSAPIPPPNRHTHHSRQGPIADSHATIRYEQVEQRYHDEQRYKQPLVGSRSVHPQVDPRMPSYRPVERPLVPKRPGERHDDPDRRERDVYDSDSVERYRERDSDFFHATLSKLLPSVSIST